MSSTQSFWLSVLASAFTTVAYIALAVVILGGLWFLDRRQLLAFFRLSSGSRQLTVLASRLEIRRGSVPTGEPHVRGYEGPAMVRLEYLGAEAIARLFWPIFIPRMPARWRQWVLERTPSISGVTVKIDTCPLDWEELHGTVVLIGAGIYNSASKYYLDEHSGSCFRFNWMEAPPSVVEVLRGPRSGQRLRGQNAADGASRELAIVQAITDREHDRVVIMCVGSGTSSSFGAARYLAENWRQVHRKAQGRDFGIVLSFPGQGADVDNPSKVRQPIKVDEHYDTIAY